MRIIRLASLLLITGLLCAIHPVSAQNSIQEFTALPVPSKRTSAADKKLKTYQTIKLPEEEIYSFVKGKTKASFRLHINNTLKWDIDLEPSNLSLSQYKRTLLTPDGKKSELRRANYLYKGVTRGNTGGKVRLSIKDNFLYGTISNAGKEYIIEPATRYGNALKNEYLLYTTDQVITDTLLQCGADEYAIGKLKGFSWSKKEQAPLEDSVICRTVPILQVADYLMLEQFNFNIDSLETFLFSNLNVSESVFNELNLGSDSTTDVGNDQIQFEVLESVISTCYTCDVLSDSKSSSVLFADAQLWLQKNHPEASNFISQFWSPRRLYSSILEVVGLAGNISNEDGCSIRSMNLLRYLPGAATDYRFIAAHEIGHSLGAAHDDAIVPEVKSFIMNSYVVTTATRFSRLEDFLPYPAGPFGDDPYSSQWMFRKHFLTHDDCYKHCTSVQNTCEIPNNLKIEYSNPPDSLLIKWQGSGTFIVLVREDSSSYSKTKDSLLVTANSIFLKGLEDCKIYSIQIGEICEANDIVWSPTKRINSTELKVVDEELINRRSSSFDLKLKIQHNQDSSGNFEVLIDNKKIPFAYKTSPQEIIMPNLFADGARHRLKVISGDNAGTCGTEVYIDFPYYRDNSTTLLQNDFNECGLGGWQDSMLTTFASDFRTPLFYVLNENKNYYFEPGSFNGSCFAYYASDVINSEIPIKKFALTSPVADISSYKNLMLSFDYQYWVNSVSQVLSNSFFSVEGFDGSAWKELSRVTTPTFVGPVIPWRIKEVWDTLPSRFFIDLSAFKNKDFQLRFVVDNGINENYQFNQYFLALDNVRLDGYPTLITDDAVTYTIVPNPATTELLLKFNYPTSFPFRFRLIDISGKRVREGTLLNDRVDVSTLPRGMYLFQLFYNNGLVGTTQKILKL